MVYILSYFRTFLHYVLRLGTGKGHTCSTCYQVLVKKPVSLEFILCLPKKY